MYKTIYFYKLDIKKLLQVEYYPEDAYYDIFDKRFKHCDIKVNKDPVWDSYASCLIGSGNNVVDVLEHTHLYLFGTIGCTKKSENRLQRIRNTTNLEHSELKLDPNTILEDYTFFFMDYLTGIISVINAQGAPNIKTLKNLLNDIEMDPVIYPIKNRNVDGALDKIEEVGGIELTFAVPPEELLGDNGLCASMEIINQFKKDGFERCQLRFYMDRKNPRRKNPKDVINHLKDTYKLVNETYNNTYKLEKLGLLATPEDERQKPIDMFELYFTKGVNITVDDNFGEESIKITLYEVYNTMKAELLKNVELHYNKVR